MQKAVTASNEQTSTALEVLQTPLSHITAEQVETVLRRVVRRNGDAVTSDVAAFGSSI